MINLPLNSADRASWQRHVPLHKKPITQYTLFNPYLVSIGLDALQKRTHRHLIKKNVNAGQLKTVLVAVQPNDSLALQPRNEQTILSQFWFTRQSSRMSDDTTNFTRTANARFQSDHATTPTRLTRPIETAFHAN